jgi:hypothetical protein
MRARTQRRRVNQGFAPGVVPYDLQPGDHLDVELLPGHDGGYQWRKSPDEPLGEKVKRQLEHRARLEQKATDEQT